MTESTEGAEALFEQGIEQYKAGATAGELIPVFKEVCDQAPKSSAALTCLAWLYLLEDKPNSALKAAQKAVKMTPQDPQGRINLALAMLETGKKGVRSHIDEALQIMMLSSDLKDEVQQNIEEGLSRKPEWNSLKRVHKWLFDS
ncbi:MAG: tetratricopeptide repeat protein [Leptolyngbyaceae cyanobacterium]